MALKPYTRSWDRLRVVDCLHCWGKAFIESPDSCLSCVLESCISKGMVELKWFSLVFPILYNQADLDRVVFNFDFLLPAAAHYFYAVEWHGGDSPHEAVRVVVSCEQPMPTWELEDRVQTVFGVQNAPLILVEKPRGIIGDGTDQGTLLDDWLEDKLRVLLGRQEQHTPPDFRIVKSNGLPAMTKVLERQRGLRAYLDTPPSTPEPLTEEEWTPSDDADAWVDGPERRSEPRSRKRKRSPSATPAPVEEPVADPTPWRYPGYTAVWRSVRRRTAPRLDGADETPRWYYDLGSGDPILIDLTGGGADPLEAACPSPASSSGIWATQTDSCNIATTITGDTVKDIVRDDIVLSAVDDDKALGTRGDPFLLCSQDSGYGASEESQGLAGIGIGGECDDEADTSAGDEEDIVEAVARGGHGGTGLLDHVGARDYFAEDGKCFGALESIVWADVEADVAVEMGVEMEAAMAVCGNRYESGDRAGSTDYFVDEDCFGSLDNVWADVEELIAGEHGTRS